MKKTNPKPDSEPQIENREEVERALLALQPADPHVRKMIELAVQGLREGVPRLTSEEIFEYLGRR
ncbi:MAG TPA: hypothetical protein VFZ34_28305 [Blastocatellia bacterium]|nr:hypothetical protein [Blastocatellia bacterium]